MTTDPSIFKIASFSTNFENNNPISLIRKFFMFCVCKGISYVKDGQVEFEHQLPDKTICHIHFSEIKKLDRLYTICSVSDCYLVIIDLVNDTSFAKIEKILSYIKDTCNLERQIYIIGIYEDIYKIHSLMKKESLSAFLNTQNLNYDYIELKNDRSNANGLVNIITSIIKELSDERKEALKNTKTKKKIEIDFDQSKSKCLIF